LLACAAAIFVNMSFYSQLLRPILFGLDAEQAHETTMRLLGVPGTTAPLAVHFPGDGRPPGGPPRPRFGARLTDGPRAVVFEAAFARLLGLGQPHPFEAATVRPGGVSQSRGLFRTGYLRRGQLRRKKGKMNGDKYKTIVKKWV